MYDVIYADKKSTAIPAAIPTKLETAKQYHVRISYTEFQTNRKINIENTDRHSLCP